MSYREAILVETIEAMKSRLRESAYKLDSYLKLYSGKEREALKGLIIEACNLESRIKDTFVREKDTGRFRLAGERVSHVMTDGSYPPRKLHALIDGVDEGWKNIPASMRSHNSWVAVNPEALARELYARELQRNDRITDIMTFTPSRGNGYIWASIDGQKQTSFLSEEYCRQLNSVGKTEKGVLERGLASKTFAEVLKMNHKVRGMKR